MPVPPKAHPQTPSDEALFRFRVVSDVLSREMRGQVRADVVPAVAALEHPMLLGGAHRVSTRTLYRWLAAYEESGLAGLAPKSRQRTTTSLVLPIELLAFARAQKEGDLRASVPEIVRRARELGVIAAEASIDRTTVYRAFVRMGIPVIRQRHAKDRDSRRFAYPHRMTMVLSDGKHFRAGAIRAKRVAVFYLDDATRFGLDVVVGPSESAVLFLRGLHGSIEHHGVSDIYYLDHGAGFIASDTEIVVSQLPSLLIHGEVRYPEGHGKIEKFNQTVQEAVLRHLVGRADVDPGCGPLELRLRHWLRETYNHTPHESLDSDTPWERFSADPRALTLPENLTALNDCFVVRFTRMVSNDHVISVDGIDFEVPRGLARSKLTVHRQILDGTLRILHQKRMVRLHPVDLTANALARRGQTPTPTEVAAVPLKSAADIAFERDFHPIVGSDGGFIDPHGSE